MPTVAPAPTVTQAPVAGIRIIATGAPVPTATPAGEVMQVRYSRYWPPLGGVNTSRPDNPQLARTASGARWQDWVGRGCACVPEWPFFTRVYIDGVEWTCVDRGGMIKTVDGVPWVDVLTDAPTHSYGEIVSARVVFP